MLIARPVRWFATHVLRLVTVALLLCTPVTAEEKLLVVVNPTADLTQLSKSKLINLYMGRDRELSKKVAALPLDINSANPVKAQFYRRLINRDITEINAYWVRIMFSGQASPPPEIESFALIAELIRSNRGTIAYVPESTLTQWPPEQYRVVYVLEPEL